MAYNNILVDREPPLLTITVNRPPANALSRATIGEIRQAIDEAAADEEVRVIIITGSGHYIFIAGADVSEFPTLDEQSGRELLEAGHALFTAIETLPKPVIAAINGTCLGGGLELAMACDIRVAVESARFGQPEINLGIMPGWGGTQRLPRLIGKGRAMELLLTGDMIKAPEAQRIGLVNRVVPEGELMAQTKNLARKLAAQAPVAMATMKKVVFEGLGQPLPEALRTEVAGFLHLFGTEDAKEGIAAFLGKRKPQFKGR
ncbi:MAG: enoyl-CoA hydratase/isomerase family protein [Firmicutes bacterium]|nr:enoyl-CoA hydratase/isomerase family protein [Bacillota bacterium]